MPETTDIYPKLTPKNVAIAAVIAAVLYVGGKFVSKKYVESLADTDNNVLVARAFREALKGDSGLLQSIANNITGGVISAIQNALTGQNQLDKLKALFRTTTDWAAVQKRYKQMYWSSLTGDIVNAVGNDAAQALFATAGATGANQYASTTEPGNSFVTPTAAAIPKVKPGANILCIVKKNDTYLYWTPRAEKFFETDDPRMYSKDSKLAPKKFKKGEFIGYATGVSETDGTNTWIQIGRSTNNPKGNTWWVLRTQVDLFPDFNSLKQAYPSNSKTTIQSMVGKFAGVESSKPTQQVLSRGNEETRLYDATGVHRDTVKGVMRLGAYIGEGFAPDNNRYIVFAVRNRNNEELLLCAAANQVIIQ